MNTDNHNLISVYQCAQEYDLSEIIEVHAKRYRQPIEDVSELKNSLLQWLAIAAVYPSRQYSITGPIDNLWHTLILDTRKYTDFCNRCLGGYLHHVPSTSDDIEYEYRDEDDPAYYPNGKRIPEWIKLPSDALENYIRLLDDWPSFGFPNTTPDSRFWPEVLPNGAVTCPSTSCCSGGGSCGCAGPAGVHP